METLTISILWKITFWLVALSFSLFYSFYAFKIHLTDENFIKAQKKNNNFAWLFHQWWFNFIGSITGWSILWILIPPFFLIFCQQTTSHISFKEFLLLLIALLGITGYLPLTLFGIAKNAEKAINTISGSK